MFVENVTPWASSSERTWGITRSDSTVWSSVMITTMLGRGVGVGSAPAVVEPETPIAKSRVPTPKTTLDRCDSTQEV